MKMKLTFPKNMHTTKLTEHICFIDWTDISKDFDKENMFGENFIPQADSVLGEYK